MKKSIYIFIISFSLLFITSCNEEEKKPVESKKTKKTFEIEKEYKRGPIILKLKIDKKELTIAQKLKLIIEVRIKEDYEVKMPEFGEKLRQFGIVNYRSPQPQLVDDNYSLHIRSYELEPFLSGDYKIPPMKIKFYKRDESDHKIHEIENEEINIVVKSLLPEDTKDLKIYDILPPEEIPGKKKPLLYYILATIIIFLAIGILIWRKKKKKIKKIIIRPAHEIAYDELNLLVAEDLIDKGEIKLFYLKLSNLLRHYIENRFFLRAPESTTEEFLYDLKETDRLSPDHKTLLREFLTHSDMVKFAELTPNNDDIQNTFNACKRFIYETELQSKDALRVGVA